MSAVKLMKWSLIPLAALSFGCAHHVSFQSQVRPILKERCLSCHSPGGQGYAKSGFSVVSYRSVMQGTKYGPVIVPGSSIGSTLPRLIEHEADPSIAMPKSHRAGQPSGWLTRHQISLIRAWIDQGAKND